MGSDLSDHVEDAAQQLGGESSPDVSRDRPRVAHRALPGPPPGWHPGISMLGGALAEDWTEEDDRILREIEEERRGPVRRELAE